VWLCVWRVLIVIFGRCMLSSLCPYPCTACSGWDTVCWSASCVICPCEAVIVLCAALCGLLLRCVACLILSHLLWHTGRVLLVYWLSIMCCRAVYYSFSFIQHIRYTFRDIATRTYTSCAVLPHRVLPYLYPATVVHPRGNSYVEPVVTGPLLSNTTTAYNNSMHRRLTFNSTSLPLD